MDWRPNFGQLWCNTGDTRYAILSCGHVFQLQVCKRREAPVFLGLYNTTAEAKAAAEQHYQQ